MASIPQSGGSSAWTSRFAFLMASVGFAVGLGNIWRFPYVTGENGGGAFVMVYLICAVGIGVPILMAEIMIGRRGKQSPPGSMQNVAEQEGRSSRWRWAGNLNLGAAFLIEIVYCVIAGWVLYYLFQAAIGGFTGMDNELAEQKFNGLLGSTGTMLFWTAVGLAITGFIVYSGVNDGIERAVRILMPTLFALLVILVIYNIFAGGFKEATDYLFTVNFSKINGSVWLAAVSQAFFSMGVAMAGMMTFGSYLPKEISIARSAVIIMFADTLVAILAGLVIFPAVFANGLDPAGGPGLIFQILPVAFAQMPGGYFVGLLFFVLLSVAAITSMVGLIEPLVAWMQETRGVNRHKASMLIVGGIGSLSLFSVLGYNTLADVQVFGKGLNDSMSYLSDSIMLPLGGLLIAVFAGWVVSRGASADELNMDSGGLFSAWHFMIRFVVPVAVAVILFTGVTG